MIFTLSIIDFITELNFLNLQNKFLSYDERSLGIVEQLQSRGEKGIFKEVKKEDFFIIYNTIQINDLKHCENIYFYKEFITKNIKIVANLTINQIILKIQKDFLYNEIERNSYIARTINNVKDVNCKIIDADYLSDEIKASIFIQIELILEYLHEEDVLDNLFKFEEKIKLKLNKNDILTFFILLRQQGAIDYKYNAELGKLIDNHFLYYDKSSNDYKEIKQSNKLLSEYGNGSKTITKSIIRLKTFFTKDNFFHLK
jgi:hypothetical protein